jgi:DNA-binding beta-propeller fold protein YncE
LKVIDDFVCIKRQLCGQRSHWKLVVLLVAFEAGALQMMAAAQPSVPVLRLERTIVLSNVTGKFDHFAMDLAGDRLFAASVGQHAVEVIDLKTDRVQQSITGLGKPHGLAFVPATGSLYVSDGTLAELRVYKGHPLALAGTIKLSDDADDMAYDPTTRQLFVGHGGSDAANPSRVSVVDTDHFALVANIDVDTHPEGIEIDPDGRRVFANIADSDEVAVIGATGKSVIANWKVTKAAENVPLAFDEQHKLIYVACRKPGMVIAIDAATGNEISSARAAEGADDLFYDSALGRIYVITDAGEVDAYEVNSARTLRPLDALQTVAGAKTGLFVPSQNLLYIGVPGNPGKPSEIRVYSTVKPGISQ